MKQVVKEQKKVNFIVDTLNTEVSVKDRIKEAKTFIMGLENSTQVGVALKYLAKFVETFIGSDGDKEVKAKLAEDTQKFIKENPNFKLIVNAVPKEIKGDKFVKSIIWENSQTKEVSEIQTPAVFVEIGLIPTTYFAKNILNLNEN